MVSKKKQKTGDEKAFLLRGIPRELLFKMRAAAAIHGKSLKSYIRDVFQSHIHQLEQNGLILGVDNAKEK